MSKEPTAEERNLWLEFFRFMNPIATEFNAKYWPVLTIPKAELASARAAYIGTFCCVFEILRSRPKQYRWIPSGHRS